MRSNPRGFNVRITAGLAAFCLANTLNPFAHAFGRGFMRAVRGRKAQAFNGHGLTHAIRINAGIQQRDNCRRANGR